jgi:hypothetical protein
MSDMIHDTQLLFRDIFRGPQGDPFVSTFCSVTICNE